MNRFAYQALMGTMRLLATGLWLAGAARAQQVTTDPASTHIFPAGGRQGTHVEVRVGGECLPPGARLRFFGDGVTAPPVLGERAARSFAPSLRRKPGEQHINYPKEWQSQIDIAADAAPGMRLWRLSCARGGTGGRPFIVGDLPEFIETEPNSLPERAERVKLPVTINGQIAGERDLDYFCFAVQAGEIVAADVVAARIGSPLDAVAEFFGPDGRRIAAEEIRVGSDPVLAFRAAVSGEHRLLVGNLGYRGDPSHVYRVTLTTAPYVRSAFPPVGRAGAARELDLLALSGDGSPRIIRRSVTFPLLPGPFWWSDADLGAAAIPLRSSSVPDLSESAANDTRESAMELGWPVTVAGRFESAADEDWYRFTCRQGTLLSVECAAAPIGCFSALPVVTLTDANGGPLAQASAVQDAQGVARIEWRAPADGDYCLRLRDLQQGVRGGAEMTYLLTICESLPDFALAVKTDFVNVLQGARTELDVAVERRGGFAGPIELTVEGLPAGARLENTTIAAGQPTGKLAFVADAEARSCDTTVRIVGRSELTAGAGMVEKTALAAHLGHDAAGVALGPTTVEHLQLTIVHKPVFKLYCNEAYQYAHRGTIHPYLMEVERLDGFDGPIRLQVADRQIKDLDGIEIPETTVSPSESQIMLPIYLPETMHINVQAHSNVYAQGHVEFLDKFGERQTLLVVSTMRCMIRTLPTVVKLRAADREFIARRGTTASCRLELDRTPVFRGGMRIELIEPSESLISAEPVEIVAGESAAEMHILVAPTAEARSDLVLKFRASGRMEDETRVISEAILPVRWAD